LNAPSIRRHHTLAEERALIVTGRDSVPIAISIVVAVSVAAHEPTDDSFMNASSVDAAAIAVAATETTALETFALSRSRVCDGCSEG
jgi:hypothetical protein